ncbi:hypothetical protein [Archangium sp.]|uniref:hypothetical protein n=1 Tax=Archangium sp. TaxID=1872627 RepID=UPI002ED8F980
MAPKEFNLERVLEELEGLAHEDARTPEQIAAIESAAKALHFIRRTGRLDDFRDYLRDFNADAELATRAEQSFSSMAEAMEWLHAQQDPPYGATVEVAGLPHLVSRQRSDKWFLVPAPPLPPPETEDGP